MLPPIPEHETERLEELHRYAILDTVPEQAYDDLLMIAAGICDTPMGAISLIDVNRQWFKARKNLGGTETPRSEAFCAHAVAEPDQIFLVPDAREDERFHDNPFVMGDPNIRFYAGAPLVSPSGLATGTLCVLDNKPRELTEFQKSALKGLARQVSALMELRLAYKELRQSVAERAWLENALRERQALLELENVELSRLSHTDPLTGLPNRRAFEAALWTATELQAQHEGKAAVAIVDIDHFKSINDTYGHPVGDQVLSELAHMLQEQRADANVVARIGGEEFAWVFPKADPAHIQAFCEGLRQKVEARTTHPPITISMGVALHDSDEELSALMKRADRALYEAKRLGRNRVQWADQ